MNNFLERLLRTVDAPDPERAEHFWAEYRAGGKGADAAFATLIAWYGNLLYRRVWGFVRSDAAEDVLQDVLAKLHRERKSFATFEHALRWLRTIAVNQAVDARRRAARSSARDRRAARPESVTVPENDGQEALSVGLAQLPADQQQAIALHYFEGLTKQDAAAVLGIHRDTFAARLREALERLRELVPVPVLLVGGVVALESRLAACPLSLTAEKVAGVVKCSLAQAASRSWVKSSLVLAGACVFGGALVATEALTRHQPPGTQPPAVATTVPVSQAVPQRSLEVFHAHILERQRTALQRLVGADWTVYFVAVQARDSRLEVDYVLRLRPEGGPGLLAPRLKLICDATTFDTWVLFDLWANGHYLHVSRTEPLVISLFGLGKRVIPLPELEEAIAAFRVLPSDDSVKQAAAEGRQRLENAARPHCGVWYRKGNPNQKCEIAVHPSGVFLGRSDGYASDCQWRLHVLPSGAIRGVFVFESEIIIAPGATRIDFPAAGDFWTRTPQSRSN